MGICINPYSPLIDQGMTEDCITGSIPWVLSCRVPPLSAATLLESGSSRTKPLSYMPAYQGSWYRPWKPRLTCTKPWPLHIKRSRTYWNSALSALGSKGYQVAFWLFSNIQLRCSYMLNALDFSQNLRTICTNNYLSEGTSAKIIQN